jgi:hypothetical protein
LRNDRISRAAAQDIEIMGARNVGVRGICVISRLYDSFFFAPFRPWFFNPRVGRGSDFS